MEEKTYAVGKRIRQARLRAKMTQDKLVDALETMGIKTDRSTIVRIEHGIQPVAKSDIKILGELLHTTEEELLGCTILIKNEKD